MEPERHRYLARLKLVLMYFFIYCFDLNDRDNRKGLHGLGARRRARTAGAWSLHGGRPSGYRQKRVEECADFRRSSSGAVHG